MDGIRCVVEINTDENISHGGELADSWCLAAGEVLDGADASDDESDISAVVEGLVAWAIDASGV